MTIGQLADTTNLSRRTIRYYVQQGLLPSPYGYGRGSAYAQEHVDAVARIHGLQAAGHSLSAIKRILAGQEPPELPKQPRNRKVRAAMATGLWTRVQLAEGLELHLDATKYNPSVEDLLAIQGAIRSILCSDTDDAIETSERKEI
ncbi:MAG: MerR family transcriptional regulator [Phycisphaerae bacterium]|jgi:DNA-binding transcriptional MerR regulator|nr:MerR family transcriptional regulator [Phycisphaerae bacterium]